MATQEDTLMSDINVVEDPSTPEPPFNTSASSPIAENRSPKQRSPINETDGAMQGVVTEKVLHAVPLEKAVNPDTMDWLNSSSDINVAKKAAEQKFSPDSQKHMSMRDIDNIDEHKPLKA